MTCMIVYLHARSHSRANEELRLYYKVQRDSLTLIPYFTAYLIHDFYISKTKGDCKKLTSDSQSASKNTAKKIRKGFFECYQTQLPNFIIRYKITYEI